MNNGMQPGLDAVFYRLATVAINTPARLGRRNLAVDQPASAICRPHPPPGRR